MVFIQAVAAENVKVRRGPLLKDKEVVTLKKGAPVVVTGFTIDPNGKEFKLRYQILHEGEEVWTTASMISLKDSAQSKLIPFVPLEGVEISGEVFLSPLSITLAQGESISVELAQQLANGLVSVPLKGIWTVAQLQDALFIKEKLAEHGVLLGSEQKGGWIYSELKKIESAVDHTAKAITGLCTDIGLTVNPAQAFMLIFAPLMIFRVGSNNVNTTGSAAVWFASNINGYQLRFGNKSFFEGTTKTRTNPRHPYTSVDLIVHELCHSINWRYPRNDHANMRLMESLQAHYQRIALGKHTLADGTTVSLKTLNDGYTFAARSSDGTYETVTDGFAALMLGHFSDTSAGMARREQMTHLMKQVILYRIRFFGGIDGIQLDMAHVGGQLLVKAMSNATSLIEKPENNINILLEVLKQQLP